MASPAKDRQSAGQGTAGQLRGGRFHPALGWILIRFLNRPSGQPRLRRLWNTRVEKDVPCERKIG